MRFHLKFRLTAFLILIFAASLQARAQVEQFEPFVPPSEWTQLRVWTSGERTHARVTFTFPTGGFRVTDWGTVERQGNQLSVDIKVERWTGGTTQAFVTLENFYDLGALAPGSYTFTVRSRGVEIRRADFDPAQIVEHWEEVTLPQSGVGHAVWTSGAATFARASLRFPDTGYRVAEWGPVVRSGNDFSVTVKVERWTGRAESKVSLAQQVFVLGENLPPRDTFTFTVKFPDGTAWSSHPWTPEGQRVPPPNPIDNPYFFIRQHYLDFFSREPDSAGLTFWSNEIIAPCSGRSDCMESSRINPSGAFFLSIEFKETGFLVHRLYRAAYGRAPRFDEFLPDTRAVGRDVIVGRDAWAATLDANKRQFVADFAARAEFKTRYPDALTPEQYVDALIANTVAGSGAGEATLPPEERDRLVGALRAGTETRGGVLRLVAESEEFSRRETNPAFVRMQYFGFLRRDPDEVGFNFWLKKLNDHGGDFVAAQMVRSFLVSGEYRARFGAN